jgi:hypothetical protein
MVKNVKAATSINLGYIGEQASPITYAYGGDMNGDGVLNDLLLFRITEVIFVSAITGTTPFTEAQQQAAFEAYIKQDPYQQEEVSMLNAMDLLYRCYID